MSTIVATRLLGGLGNQLFQWAAGAAVAQATGAELRIDPRPVEGRTRYRLPELGLDAPRWTGTATTEALLRLPGLWRFCRAAGWSPRWRSTRLRFDRLRGFDPSIPSLLPSDGTLILTGYWQAPEWAEAVRDRLRPVVTPCVTEVIGVHVRRGDYTAQQRIGAYHGVLGVEYYRRALDALGREVTTRPVMIFTDEPDRVRGEGWVPASARWAEPASDLEHLRAMAGCAHLITANSSFSWWAAWFGERPGRRVIVPNEWWSATAGAIPHPAPPAWQRI
ncbi:MAG: alpha-1,2-fucosyltransferase [Phycisphaeraceae bacterium]|nr:alpha-1,2-fucosyltransferase [Phycisphaeraceae bacterium]